MEFTPGEQERKEKYVAGRLRVFCSGNMYLGLCIVVMMSDAFS